MKGKRLTPKQIKFIDAYIKHGNAAKAAREAGYSEKYVNTHASKMLQNATIFEEYQRRLQELSKAQIASEKEVLEFHTGIMRGNVKEEVINPVTGKHEELPAGLNIRQKSADALLKHMQHVPSDLQNEEQTLKNEKLKAEIERLKAGLPNDDETEVIQYFFSRGEQDEKAD